MGIIFKASKTETLDDNMQNTNMVNEINTGDG